MPDGPTPNPSLDALVTAGGSLAQAVAIAQAESLQFGHAQVDVGHLFLGLLQAFPNESHQLVYPAGLTPEDLVEAVRAALPAGGPRADGAAPDAPVVPTASLVEALKIASDLSRGQPVAFEHVFVGLVRSKDSMPRRVIGSFGVESKALEAAALSRLSAVPHDPQRAKASADKKNETSLARLTRDLVARARLGKMDPVIGREREIDAVLETLARRTKNNPILVGEPGVGKSAIIDGLAQRIAKGLVPGRLGRLKLLELSVADLVAGTQYRGDFEARIQKLVEETSKDPDVVLFIDEIHTILSAGGQPGTGDAAALLKPHLSRGDLRCIGATTTDEYRKFIEKDRALVRRFQAVNVPAPTPEECLKILEGLKPGLEQHHGVTIDSSAILAAVQLSHRYQPERHLPDKAIDLLDQACARKMLRAFATGAPRTIAAADILAILRDQLGKKLGAVAEDESEKLLGIEASLKSRVVGQDHVAKRVAERILLTRRQLQFRPERPAGVFLFLGPTGVGKTEIARALADYLFGSQDQLLRYDLSEFSEPHSVSRIVGSPPGYVGYDDEGHQLTSKVRSNPQSILLLDEIEKAHPAVLNLFLQVFEDGRLTDAQGRTVSFSEVTIILTSNVGAEAFRRREAIGFGKADDEPPDTMRETARDILQDRLPLELLNRMDEILVFNPLGREQILAIAERLVARATERFRKDGKTIEVDASAIRFLGETGYDPTFGARHLQRNVEQLLLQPLARETYMSDWALVEKILVTKEGSALVFEKLSRALPMRDARPRTNGIDGGSKSTKGA